jgi:hypothetical protein
MGQRAKIEMVTGLNVRVLQYLDEHEAVDTLHLAELFRVEHQKVVGAVKSLQSLGDVSLQSQCIMCEICPEFTYFIAFSRLGHEIY